jgi:hypothetical protein
LRVLGTGKEEHGSSNLTPLTPVLNKAMPKVPAMYRLTAGQKFTQARSGLQLGFLLIRAEEKNPLKHRYLSLPGEMSYQTAVQRCKLNFEG